MSGDEEERGGDAAAAEECAAAAPSEEHGAAPPSEEHGAAPPSEEHGAAAHPESNFVWFGTKSGTKREAPAWLPAGTAIPLTSGETPFQTKARENFAASKSRDVSTVSVREVMESHEGVQAWAFLGIDCSSSGNLNRSLARELEKPVNAHVAKYVRFLPPSLAEKFRMA